ncbi:MAG: NB-ARC domain-containing protein [Aggregatilineales bacterium]
METQKITLESLENALKAWKRAELPPRELLELDWLRRIAGDDEARLNMLRDTIYQYVTRQLVKYRVRLGVPLDGLPPQTLAALKTGIANDFATQHAPLELWSACYHQYVECSLGTGELVRAALGSTERTFPSDEQHFRRRTRDALRLLCSAVRQWQAEAQKAGRRVWLPNAEYSNYLDSGGAVEEITQLLSATTGPRLLSIEGLGGIGKTALARRIAEHILIKSEMARVIWISARQIHFNPAALNSLEPDDYAAHSRADVISTLVNKLGYEHLNRLSTDAQIEQLIPIFTDLPALVVIDNLETLDDSRLLIPDLKRLQGATRFLLTSRDSLAGFDGVYIYPVPGLSLGDSQKLLEAEIGRLGTKRSFTRVEAKQIYDTVGGVPLALKLIAAQFAVVPDLSKVLEGVRKAERGEKPELMFDFIYRRTWRLLTAAGRRLLVAIYDSVSPDGEELGWLERMAEAEELTGASFKAALEELHVYALLEITTTQPPCYALHRLTITFLQTNIAQAHWSDGLDNAN